MELLMHLKFGTLVVLFDLVKIFLLDLWGSQTAHVYSLPHYWYVAGVLTEHIHYRA